MTQLKSTNKKLKAIVLVSAIFLSFLLLFSRLTLKDTYELDGQETKTVFEVHGCQIQNMRSRKEIQNDLDFEYDKAKKRALRKELKELEREIQKVCG